MLRYLSAGESHGPALTVLVDGVPAGLPLVASEHVDPWLRRRQIPVLGSIPIVGDLFSQNITEEDSVDLLIILTAQILD